MQAIRDFFCRLFKRPGSKWDKLAYGKPSDAGDEFRKRNEA